MTNLLIPTPQPYDFAKSVQDHGWVALRPFQWDAGARALGRVERLATGRVVVLHVTDATADLGDGSAVQVAVAADGGELSEAELDEVRRSVRWMLRLDEDLSSFYDLCARHPDMAAKMGTGRGRLLRSPTVFEDVVKTIFTTNITWPQTKTMAARFVATLGDPLPQAPELRTFPTPEQVAAASDVVFQTDLRMGYRGPYVRRLAQDIVAGRRDLEGLKTASLSAAELKNELRTIKGVGDYAAGTLLMLLGHYEALALDSQMRRFVSTAFYEGRPVSEREIAAVYEPWGRWKYLAYWFEFAATWAPDSGILD